MGDLCLSAFQINKISLKKESGRHLIAQLIKLSSVMSASQIKMPDQVPATLLPILLPVYASWEEADVSSSAWTPVTHMGDPDRVLGSWLWSGPVLPIVGI